MSMLAALVGTYDRLTSDGEVPLFGYSPISIAYVIGLNEDGTVATVAQRGDGTRKPSPLLIPQPAKKSSNISPNFLWGNSSYVLGVTGSKKKAQRVAGEHSAFVQYHVDALRETNDAGLQALLTFLSNWRKELFATPPWPEEVLDKNIIFALETERLRNIYLHDRPAARMIWKRLLSAGQGREAICLVTGEKAPVARLHPRIRGIKNPNGKQADSIVSFNKDAFKSYGHEQGDNAPVSEWAAFAYTATLNKYLERGGCNRIQIGDASTVSWAEALEHRSAAEAEGLFAAMFTEIDETSEAQKVGALLERIRRGQPLREVAPQLSQGVRFYVLGLAPNAARLSIRFWLEDDFGRIAENYQRFVSDMAVEPGPRPNPALWKYLQETAVPRKTENVPPNLAGEWMRAILSGTTYPLTLLSTVLMRIRSDKEVNALRVGMLRALLVRNYGMAKEASVAIDVENTNKGYLLGRLFAAYEYAQTAALGSRVNSTIKDKFYGAASAQPRKVFALLERASANHLSKVGKQRPRFRDKLAREIGAIMEQMSPTADPFPASLTAQEQALFGLGYYHQRNEFFRSRKVETADEGETE